MGISGVEHHGHGKQGGEIFHTTDTSRILCSNTRQNLPPAIGSPYISRLSPNNKPALSRQRDHSACRRPKTPLKVRKTRENLKQQSLFDSIPPPCVHTSCSEHEPPSPVSSATTLVGKDHPTPQRNVGIRDINNTPISTRKIEYDAASTTEIVPAQPLERQKSISRRVLSKVKQSIGTRTKSSHSVRPTESELSLVRRLSGRRKYSHEIEQRAQSFEITRTSVDSNIDETPESIGNILSSEQRSVTASTVSTAELLGSQIDESVPRSAPSPTGTSSPSPTPTPRPPPRLDLPPTPSGTAESLQVPCIDLCVSLSCASVDLHSKHDIWVAIEATVRSMATTLGPRSTSGPSVPNASAQIYPLAKPLHKGIHTATPTIQRSCGSISTLRLCYKPVGGCSVREVIGQKSMRDVAVGQECRLFVKVHIPRLRIKTQSPDMDPESLFAELESIVGTLKTEILHVEARYRHTLLPSDNVVTVRHTCKIKRPEAGSRWSLAGSDNDFGSSSDVHVLLAQYIAMRHSAAEALDMLQKYIDPVANQGPAIRRLRDSLSGKAHLQLWKASEDLNPSVVVTDSELDITTTVTPGPDEFATAPTTPTADDNSTWPMARRTSSSGNALLTFIENPGLLSSTPPIIPKRKTMTRSAESALLLSSFKHTTPRPPSPSIKHDSARQVWQHIRRSSLSAKQLDSITNGGLHLVDHNDEAVKELHRQALANKRSVGAETLRAWKWDHTMQDRQTGPESPWM